MTEAKRAPVDPCPDCGGDRALIGLPWCLCGVDDAATCRPGEEAVRAERTFARMRRERRAAERD